MPQNLWTRSYLCPAFSTLKRMLVPDPLKKRMTKSSRENKNNEYLYVKWASLDRKAMYNQVPEYSISWPIRTCKVEPIGITSPKQSKCWDRCISAHKRKNQNEEEQTVRQGQGAQTPLSTTFRIDQHWLLHTPFTEGLEKGVAVDSWLCAVSHTGDISRRGNKTILCW